MTKKKRSIALGNFDGLHLGHMAVINSAKLWTELSPCVLLLEPLPFRKDGQALITDQDKAELLERNGVEVIKTDFLKIKDYEPEKFFEEILLKELNAGAICCGFNYHFGKGGKGDARLLESLCKSAGIAFFAANSVDFDGEAISSTRIRSALQNGKIQEANAMLGRSFGYKLEVVHGDKIGRKIGCPTINQLFPSELIVPKYGVYSSQTVIDGKEYRCVTNIGRRPSFENNEQRSETHIIGFDGDLYGQFVQVCLIDYKRGEKKFNSLEELKEQLNKDKAFSAAKANE